MTTTEKNMALLRGAYQLVEKGDLDAAEKLLAEDFVANLPGLSDPLVGREIWRFGTQAMLDAFPDLEIDVRDMFGADDRVAVLVHFRGTHRGAFQEIAATGRRVGIRSVELYRFADGRIAEEWVAPDIMDLMRQIGPAPTGA
ncbi:ester cyclase [Streptomycetaceae bacterium NBC_01309]